MNKIRKVLFIKYFYKYFLICTYAHQLRPHLKNNVLDPPKSFVYVDKYFDSCLRNVDIVIFV